MGGTSLQLSWHATMWGGELSGVGSDPGNVTLSTKSRIDVNQNGMHAGPDGLLNNERQQSLESSCIIITCHLIHDFTHDITVVRCYEIIIPSHLSMSTRDVGCRLLQP